MRQIETNKGIYQYTPVLLEVGNKTIVKEIAKQNLFYLKEVFDKNNIPFFLDFGTLLGAVREKDFISHDEDVDIGVLDEFRSKVFDALFDLREQGLEVVRYYGDLLSVMREGEYIDIYFYRKAPMGLRLMNNEKIKEKYIIKTQDYEFLGKTFKVPYDFELYLEKLYGEDWMIPQKGKHAFNSTRLYRFKQMLKKSFPSTYSAIKKLFYNWKPGNSEEMMQEQ